MAMQTRTRIITFASLLCFVAAAMPLASADRTERAATAVTSAPKKKRRAPAAPVEPSLAANQRRSRSIGYPWQGRLTRPAALTESAYIYHVPEYAVRGRHFGTWELVQLLQRAAFRVAHRLPGAKLSIGDLSAPSGGDIDDHGSHESGRDADIAFYLKDRQGEPYYARTFVKVAPNGLSEIPGVVFDDQRNWEMIARLITDGDARVQYVFVSEGVRRRLLAEARRRNASRTVVERAEQLLVQPARAKPHDNHFHIRVYCSPGNRPLCKDRSPFWAWYPGDAIMATR